MNKKGYSTGFTWIYGLVILFGLGILYIVFNQVFTAHLVPVISQQITDSTTIDTATKAQTIAEIDKYMVFFHILPFVLFVVVIIYMVVAAVRKEGEGDFTG
jgi:flagellar biosynthesis protein FlhB